MLVTSLFLISPERAVTQPVRLQIPPVRAQAPGLGLTLRAESLETAPQLFERQLCLPLSVIGRVQEISDTFDLRWAQRLDAHHQRPWITLQFGRFGTDGEAPLSATLLAIANGVQDANLQRWAQEIHAYGQPIYLTILLHVDRNWAVSSAVANGGIPQDTAPAWEHVRSIFNAAGDTNVAWVWAPADPAHDQPYAPPARTIGAILQSTIRYPGAPWPDPTPILRADTARHPGKPLFVEVSADGSPGEKAAWLQRVVASVQAFPNVYALFYHEGSPNLHATRAEDAGWSFASDPLSVWAMRDWRALVPAGSSPCGAGARMPTSSTIAISRTTRRDAAANMTRYPAGEARHGSEHYELGLRDSGTRRQIPRRRLPPRTSAPDQHPAAPGLRRARDPAQYCLPG